MKTHGRRDQDYRPASRLVDEAQENGWAVKAQTPPKNGEDECCLNDSPSVERGCALFGRHDYPHSEELALWTKSKQSVSMQTEAFEQGAA
jgi:hypothetical protein